MNNVIVQRARLNSKIKIMFGLNYCAIVNLAIGLNNSRLFLEHFILLLVEQKILMEVVTWEYV